VEKSKAVHSFHLFCQEAWQDCEIALLKLLFPVEPPKKENIKRKEFSSSTPDSSPCCFEAADFLD
jgi:hypothetical protein